MEIDKDLIDSPRSCPSNVYVAIGIDLEGQKDVLGIWTSATEGAKFWLQVLTELKNRGVKDIFIACVDGSQGTAFTQNLRHSHRLGYNRSRTSLFS